MVTSCDKLPSEAGITPKMLLLARFLKDWANSDSTIQKQISWYFTNKAVSLVRPPNDVGIEPDSEVEFRSLQDEWTHILTLSSGGINYAPPTTYKQVTFPAVSQLTNFHPVSVHGARLVFQLDRTFTDSLDQADLKLCSIVTIREEGDFYEKLIKGDNEKQSKSLQSPRSKALHWQPQLKTLCDWARFTIVRAITDNRIVFADIATAQVTTILIKHHDKKKLVQPTGHNMAFILHASKPY
jgi:hypothetical protein